MLSAKHCKLLAVLSSQNRWIEMARCSKPNATIDIHRTREPVHDKPGFDIQKRRQQCAISLCFFESFTNKQSSSNIQSESGTTIIFCWKCFCRNLSFKQILACIVILHPIRMFHRQQFKPCFHSAQMCNSNVCCLPAVCTASETVPLQWVSFKNLGCFSHLLYMQNVIHHTYILYIYIIYNTL